MGQGPKSASWNDVSNEADPEEVLLRNTYVNGLAQKFEKIDNKNKSYTKRIIWADYNNQNNKSPLCSTNLGKELMYQKDIKPIISHKSLKPNKSALKSRSKSVDIKKSNNLYSSKISESINMSNNNMSMISNNTPDLKNLSSSTNNPTKLLSSVNFSDNKSGSTSNDLLKNYTNLGNMYSNINTTHSETNHYQMHKIPSQNEIKSKENLNSSVKNSQINNLNPDKSSSIQNNISNNINSQVNNSSSRQNNFTNNVNNPQQRSFSVGNDPEKNKNTATNNKENNKGETNIIIASKYKNVVHNSYNNIYIQSPQDLDKIYNNNYDSNVNNQNKNERPLSQTKKENTNPQNYVSNIGSNYMGNSYKSNDNKSPIGNSSVSGGNSNSYIKDLNSMNIQNSNKLTKSGENQRLLQNNFFSNNSSTNTNSSSNSILNYNKLKVIDYNTQSGQNIPKNQIGYNQQNYNSSIKNQTLTNPLKQQGFTINNYQPELNKKNNFNSNSNSSTNTGLLNRPSSQGLKQGPIKIHNEYDKKPSTPDTSYNHNNLSTVKLMPSKNVTSSQSGIIKRSVSKTKSDPNERPSTAPQKEKDKILAQQSSMKRLPSPNLKSTSTGLGSSQKNISTNLGSSINMSKYRSPSPSIINKSSTITIGSLKSASGKNKWK